MKFAQNSNHLVTERKCKEFHGINNIMPLPGDTSLDGKTCDCGKLIYYKEFCGCPNAPEGYQLKSKPNPDYVEIDS